MLDILGLDALSERVYQELVAAGTADAHTLAERTELAGEAVKTAVELLVELGLVTRQAATGNGDVAGAYAAAPPAVALGALLAEHRYALHKAELALAALAESYRSAAADRSSRDLVEVVCGAEAVLQRFEQVQRGAVHELMVMSEARYEVVGPGESPAEEQAIARGVRYRVVLEREALEFPGAIDGLALHGGKSPQSRVVERVPAKLIVADRSVALVPLSDGSNPDTGREPVAMYVRAPGLIRLLIGLFESVWERAVPVRLGEAGGIEAEPQNEPTGLDLRILSLLMLGSTDAAIAKQLGLGLRTVQRRVAHMMELAGVSTRLQLGWHARHRHWLG
ncbi:MAG TPA: TrmB family transcriptional regulator [Actinocrinis sp.]|jgi:sugar-specific transcriptional regulator TrmB/DNA-binding CsgD family transcriptional regulator|uniref:TrmB family transcriptional regulator n=1 Tax=Actinocrinis sp. TaxID=1920516 RepID=UPI002DDCAB06|nr:TrmB family transcriptional regulator [Actinocrinis sp.]HEV3174252.1 TrmB family transcriptional regulator [Actinocrinis sp.]